MRVGIGFDVHPFISGRRLILGGVEIPFEKGLFGHSDADALTHAIIDALFGAAGLGDIGSHFGIHDSRYKDATSLLLLEEAWQRISTRGYVVENVDATIIAEAPRLSPFLEKMRLNIARVLRLSLDLVNVKASSANGVGPLGAGEGIAAFAVAALQEGKG